MKKRQNGLKNKGPELNQLCFYFINDNQKLITSTNSSDLRFVSNDDFFFEINGMDLTNDRSRKDFAALSPLIWEGIT